MSSLYRDYIPLFPAGHQQVLLRGMQWAVPLQSAKACAIESSREHRATSLLPEFNENMNVKSMVFHKSIVILQSID